VEVTGKRSDLQKLNRDTISAVVDISRLRSAGQYTLSYDVNYTTELGNLDVSFSNRAPYRVSLVLEKLDSRPVEVKTVFSGNVAEGYLSETMTCSHDTITVEGPAEIVDKISYAQVILDRTNVDKTVVAELEYTLIDKEGQIIDSTEISCDVKTVEVTLPVVMFKEVPLKVEFLSGSGATGEDVAHKISPEFVTISGDAALLEGVTQISLGNIDLGEMGTSAEFNFPILIPNEAKNISGDETATVTVRIRGMETKTLRVTNIGFVNVPEGCEAISMTQQLQVVVRARTSAIGNIEANNLRAVADLSSVTSPGTYTVPVTMYIDGYQQAGAVGDYSVVALVSTVEPAEAEE